MHYTSLMIISIVKLDKIYTFRKLNTMQKNIRYDGLFEQKRQCKKRKSQRFWLPWLCLLCPSIFAVILL